MIFELCSSGHLGTFIDARATEHVIALANNSSLLAQHQPLPHSVANFLEVVLPPAVSGVGLWFVTILSLPYLPFIASVAPLFRSGGLFNLVPGLSLVSIGAALDRAIIKGRQRIRRWRSRAEVTYFYSPVF